jgi:hypothetical protein
METILPHTKKLKTGSDELETLKNYSSNTSMLPIGIWDYFISLQQKSNSLRNICRIVKKMEKKDLLQYQCYRYQQQPFSTVTNSLITNGDDRFVALDSLFSMESLFTKTNDYLTRLVALLVEYESKIPHTITEMSMTTTTTDSLQLHHPFHKDIVLMIDMIPQRPRTDNDTLLLVQLANSVSLRDPTSLAIRQQFINIVQGRGKCELSIGMRTVLEFLVPCLIGFGLFKEYQKIHSKRMEMLVWYHATSGTRLKCSRAIDTIEKEFDSVVQLEKRLAVIFLRVAALCWNRVDGELSAGHTCT